jgi:hypothetical protein
MDPIGCFKFENSKTAESPTLLGTRPSLPPPSSKDQVLPAKLQQGRYHDLSTPCRLPNRHTFGLTMPTPTGIVLAMERKLTVRSCYQCLKPCRDTPKLVPYGKSTSTRSSTTSTSCTPRTSVASTEVRSMGRLSSCADKSTTSLSLAPTLLWRKA